MEHHFKQRFLVPFAVVEVYELGFDLETAKRIVEGAGPWLARKSVDWAKYAWKAISNRLVESGMDVTAEMVREEIHNLLSEVLAEIRENNKFSTLASLVGFVTSAFEQHSLEVPDLQMHQLEALFRGSLLAIIELPAGKKIEELVGVA